MSVRNDDSDIPQSSTQEKIVVLEKTLAGIGDDEPILVGKRVLEKELEKLQKKLNGPKKTAKHIEPNRIGSTENPNASRPKVHS